MELSSCLEQALVVAGMESAPSEDNLDSKGGNSSNPALNMLVNSGRAYSSEDLRSIGAPMSGPSGTPPSASPGPSTGI